jgi:hypothetical protein
MSNTEAFINGFCVGVLAVFGLHVLFGGLGGVMYLASLGLGIAAGVAGTSYYRKAGTQAYEAAPYGYPP